MKDWRQEGRWDALRLLARHSRRATWSSALLRALVDELYVGEEFERLIGDPRRVPVRRYPQALSVALALRHSWRPDDFQRTVDHLFPGGARKAHHPARTRSNAADRRHRR